MALVLSSLRCSMRKVATRVNRNSPTVTTEAMMMPVLRGLWEACSMHCQVPFTDRNC